MHLFLIYLSTYKTIQLPLGVGLRPYLNDEVAHVPLQVKVDEERRVRL